MAQIVTITNPLTGQPAQVDQLEHTAQEIDGAIARALPGGDIDTLLNGKAPAGYGGFGEALPYITAGNDDADGSKFDALIEAKFATLSNNTTLQLIFDCYPYVSDSVFFGTLWKRGDNYGVLTGWSYDGSIIRKVKTGGVWCPFEWVNPPLTLGKEYRTTERYLGKPVYAMIINCGMSEDNKIIRVTPENGLGTLIRGDVVLGREPAFYIAGNDFSNSYSRYANVEQNGGQIEISLRQGSSYGSMQTYAIVYYTKE